MESSQLLNVLVALVSVLLAFLMAQTALLWRSIGSLQSSVRSLDSTVKKAKGCPFGECPVFERATQEAAPKRSNLEE